MVVGVVLGALALGIAYWVIGRGPSALPPDPYTAWAASVRPRQEVVQARGRFSKVFQVAPDMTMLRLSSEPIHFRNTAGEWEEIDLTVQSAPPEAEYGLEATHNEAQVFFKKQAVGSGYLVKYAARGGEVEFGVEAEQSWGKLQSVQAQVQGHEVLYPDLFPGVDLRYELSPSHLWEEFVVHDAAAAHEITALEKRFRARNVAWPMEDGAILFTQPGSGEVLWRVPRPVMYERGNPEVKSYGLHYELEEREGYVLLRKVIDPDGIAWLRDSSRRFPLAIDATVDLSDQALTTGTADAGYGDGYVRKDTNSSTNCQDTATFYNRIDSQSTNYIGCYLPSTTASVYRAFFEWNTTAVNGVTDITGKIQAVGVYLNGIHAYNNEVVFTQLSGRPSSYSTAEALWTAIGTGLEYLHGASLAANFNYLTLGCKPTNTTTSACISDRAITDLQNGLQVNGGQNLFSFGMKGRDETHLNIYGSYTAKEDTGSPGNKPDLVVFYKGIAGATDEPNRPLRNVLWDGSKYWVWYNTSDPIGVEYAYLDPAVGTWTRVGNLSQQDSTISSKHHALWYDADNNKVYLAYHAKTGSSSLVGDLKLLIGTIQSTSITWSTARTVFQSDDSTEGYDFPSIFKNTTTGYCWAASRYGVPPTSPDTSIPYKIRVVRSSSSTNDCATWPDQTSYQDVLQGTATAMADFLAIGGYIVPWSTDRAYVVVKDHQYDADPDPLLGSLCTNTGTCPTAAESIDTDTGKGVYMFGLSVLGINDEVHLAYIDCATDCNAVEGSSLKYIYRSAGASGTWQGLTTVSGSTAIFHNPSLTRSDNSTNDLYLFVRTDRPLTSGPPATPMPHSASGAVYYSLGTRSTGSGPYTWGTINELATGLLGIWGPVDGDRSGYSLMSNYSGKGYNSTTKRVIAAWVEGIWAMNANVLAPSQ